MAAAGAPSDPLDARLIGVLRESGFTGRIQSTLKGRLGRPIDPGLADLGRLLFFDKIMSLHSDNACAGCHAPSRGFGDTQSIAIGIQNNDLVGESLGPAQSTANADGRQRGVLSGSDVERPVLRRVRRSIRQFPGVRLSST
jgi:cytochrome c peroxidase